MQKTNVIEQLFRYIPHIHLIATDGKHYRPNHPIFRKAKGLTDEHIKKLLTKSTSRVLSHLQQRGYPNADGEIVVKLKRNDLFEEFEYLGMGTKVSPLA